MTLSASFLALILMGADEPQKPSHAISPNSPTAISLVTGNAVRIGCWPCQQVGYVRYPETYPYEVPPAIKALSRMPAGDRASLETICATLGLNHIIKGTAIYACSASSGPGSACFGIPTWEYLQAHPASPPMAMPKVAPPRTLSSPGPRETWPMTLSEAFRIALDNSEIVRVIASDRQARPVGGAEPTALKTGTSPRKEEANRPPIVIARSCADTDAWRFRSEVMAEVRSVEQQYWNLAQAHVQLWCAERAVSLAREVLNREEAKLLPGHGTIADVAEAAQRVEQFELDLVTRTSDVITTERQLRNLLGLPPADNRRIVPITPVTEARVQPDWDASLAEMLCSQPDVLQQKALVRTAEIQFLLASDPWLSALSPVGNPPHPQDILLRSRAYLRQVEHQLTHALARFFLEIDANYKQIQTAARLRAAAAQRLDAQRAYYEEGRITIDRFFDAIAQYATAVATEAQYKATYNISLAAFEEARGTLLAYDNVIVAEVPLGAPDRRGPARRGRSGRPSSDRARRPGRDRVVARREAEGRGRAGARGRDRPRQDHADLVEDLDVHALDRWREAHDHQGEPHDRRIRHRVAGKMIRPDGNAHRDGRDLRRGGALAGRRRLASIIEDEAEGFHRTAEPAAGYTCS